MNKNNSFSFKISSTEKKAFLEKNKSKLILVNNNNNNNCSIEQIYKYYSLTITFYKNLTCLIQGQNAYEVVKKFFLNKITINSSFEAKEKNNLIYTSYKNIIGSDEVGVGDYFGGLVVCAVFLPSNLEEYVIQLGVKDSKKISDEKIIIIAKELIKYLVYEVKIFTPKEYNFAYEKYQNTHVLKTILHYQAISEVIIKLQSSNTRIDKVVIDEYATKQNFISYLKKANFKNLEYIKMLSFCQHAESKYLAVACASIIARYYFLKQINSLSKQINCLIPLGAWNSKIETIAKQIIKNEDNPISKLMEYVKLHFSNTKKILN